MTDPSQPYVPQLPASQPASHPPAVPAGPGAQAPFPMPPVEGKGVRLAWALGIAGLALVLCLGGGLAAVVGLVFTGTQAINEQAHVVVGNYLGALRDEKYSEAYKLLCDSEQQRLTVNQFTSREKTGPRLTSFELGQVPFDANTTELLLPVTVHYASGSTATFNYRLVQDQKTAQLEVCGRA